MDTTKGTSIVSVIMVNAARDRAEELTQRLEQLHAESEAIERELEPLTELLEVWGSPAPVRVPVAQPSGAAGLPPLPKAIEKVMVEAGKPLEHEAIRRGLFEIGFSKENFGPQGSYYFKAMARLKKTGRIHSAGTGFAV